jgi:hypothetical protein
VIVYQHRIFRADLRANPNVLYVFGDNLERVGMAGQAGEMRGEPNAVGVATKKSPASGPGAFFSDDEYQDNIEIIYRDYAPLDARRRIGGVIIVPTAGIGTGLSQMPSRCPITFEFICSLGLGGVAL